MRAEESGIDLPRISQIPQINFREICEIRGKVFGFGYANTLSKLVVGRIINSAGASSRSAPGAARPGG
jgi:hypothetical protein